MRYKYYFKVIFQIKIIINVNFATKVVQAAMAQLNLIVHFAMIITFLMMANVFFVIIHVLLVAKMLLIVPLVFSINIYL